MTNDQSPATQTLGIWHLAFVIGHSFLRSLSILSSPTPAPPPFWVFPGDLGEVCRLFLSRGPLRIRSARALVKRYPLKREGRIMDVRRIVTQLTRGRKAWIWVAVVALVAFTVSHAHCRSRRPSRRSSALPCRRSRCPPRSPPGKNRSSRPINRRKPTWKPRRKSSKPNSPARAAYAWRPTSGRASY